MAMSPIRPPLTSGRAYSRRGIMGSRPTALKVTGFPMAPSSIRRLARAYARSKRRMKPIWQGTPARSTAATARSQSARGRANGFSQKMGRPAPAAAPPRGADHPREGGVDTDTIRLPRTGHRPEVVAGRARRGHGGVVATGDGDGAFAADDLAFLPARPIVAELDQIPAGRGKPVVVDLFQDTLVGRGFIVLVGRHPGPVARRVDRLAHDQARRGALGGEQDGDLALPVLGAPPAG